MLQGFKGLERTRKDSKGLERTRKEMSKSQQLESVFGTNANLYSDVLEVDQNANITAILQAYLEKWSNTKNEMKMAQKEEERLFVQKKLEALHFTYRALTNSDCRRMYNEMLLEITNADSSPNEELNLLQFQTKFRRSNLEKANRKVFQRFHVQKKEMLQGTNPDDHITQTGNMEADEESFEIIHQDHLPDESFFTNNNDDSINRTIDSLVSELNENDSIELEHPRTIINQNKIQNMVHEFTNEMKGAKDDTAMALQQVWNAFLIQPNELDNLFNILENEREDFYDVVHKGIHLDKNTILKKRPSSTHIQTQTSQ